ncbi:MAG: methionyl-tRNA formyltransferase [Chloroflexi bacterium]|nr:methionyl-tRNA formyltransferase [Chloroflexota bacterium]
MRVIYMGTPAFVIPPLEQLVESGYQVVGVYTQPDRPTGRGRNVAPSPIKAYAEEHGLRVFQPTSLRDENTYKELAALEPDIMVIAAYGRILPSEVVNLPPLGCVNIHPSLLPRYRGPSPVAFTLLEGDETAGVTLMLLNEGMDSGPILAQEEHALLPQDTVETLTDRLFREGARLLVKNLPLYARGDLAPRPQEEALATYARKLTKEDGAIRWELSAESLWREVRAYSPWPGSYTHWQGKLLKVLDAVPLPGGAGSPPGKVVLLETDAAATVGVVTEDGILGLKRVQLEGKRDVDARDFLQGYEGFQGSVLPC